ncbi:MAG: GIY-YIG nuclease family protein [Spirochaetaceae bacterium]|nr:GIY-YIG nuclease family protein [Spirochaetaceae bacterium]
MNASDKKTIQLYLMDGNVNGRIKCTIGGWTGVVYKIPRTDLEKCKDRDHLKQTGVYFLFGTDEETGKELIYIGQAGVRKNGAGISCRLQEHKRSQDKDYWTEAVAITTTDDTFGPTEMNYLENKFTRIASDSKRYIVKNGNEPNPGNVSEEKESELEGFIENVKIIIGALGYKVFAPLEITTEDNQEESQILHCRASKIDATGRVTSDGFVLLKGSRVRTERQASCKEYISETRKKYAEKISKDGILVDDIIFKSPSGAACFVWYGSVNGMEAWKNDEGKTLKQLEK